jgi:hypothetical protein
VMAASLLRRRQALREKASWHPRAPAVFSPDRLWHDEKGHVVQPGVAVGRVVRIDSGFINAGLGNLPRAGELAGGSGKLEG